MSIATELQNYNDGLLATYAKINDKGGTVPANKNLDNLPTAIDSIPSGGGGGVELKDINFYDYDGTIVESWTLAELATKTALPENPTHAGLTAEGWNWSLATLKTNNLPQDVGQIYTPTDGKTHLIIDNTDGYLNPILGIGVNGTAIIDWGDGTSTTTITGSNVDTMQDATHTYAVGGTYDVSIELASGATGKINGGTTYPCQIWKATAGQPTWSKMNRVYSKQVKEIHIGGGWSKLLLTYALGLEAVTLPKSLTFLSSNSLRGCEELLHVNIPDTITSIGSSVFGYCRALQSISLPNLDFNQSSMFDNCVSLKRLTLPRVMTSIPQQFCYYCQKLEDIVLHEGITALNSSCFYACSSGLFHIKIPSTVTAIQNQAFSDTSCLLTVDLSTATSVPTAGTIIFGSVNASTFDGFRILVPSALESSFESASGWSTYVNYIVGV